MSAEKVTMLHVVRPCCGAKVHQDRLFQGSVTFPHAKWCPNRTKRP